MTTQRIAFDEEHEAAEVILAEGSCEGVITTAPKGDGGFGYDPLFYSPELGCTFAEAGVSDG